MVAWGGSLFSTEPTVLFLAADRMAHLYNCLCRLLHRSMEKWSLVTDELCTTGVRSFFDSIHLLF